MVQALEATDSWRPSLNSDLFIYAAKIYSRHIWIENKNKTILSLSVTKPDGKPLERFHREAAT